MVMTNTMTELAFDQALEKFIDTFLALHPKNTWPRWFKTHTTYGGKRDANNQWIFAFTAIPKDALSDGEIWKETSNGTYALVTINKTTGENEYVISNTSDKSVTLFEAIIDPITTEVSVIKDIDFDQISSTQLLPIRK